ERQAPCWWCPPRRCRTLVRPPAAPRPRCPNPHTSVQRAAGACRGAHRDVLVPRGWSRSSTRRAPDQGDKREVLRQHVRRFGNRAAAEKEAPAIHGAEKRRLRRRRGPRRPPTQHPGRQRNLDGADHRQRLARARRPHPRYARDNLQMPLVGGDQLAPTTLVEPDGGDRQSGKRLHRVAARPTTTARKAKATVKITSASRFCRRISVG